jgi:hypothetical protein
VLGYTCLAGKRFQDYIFLTERGAPLFLAAPASVRQSSKGV